MELWCLFGSCSSDASSSHFLLLCRNLFKGTVHNKLPSRMVLYRCLVGALHGRCNSLWKPPHRYNWRIANQPPTYQHSPKHHQGKGHTHSAASFAINHALLECSNSRLSLGGQPLGSEHGSSQDGGLLKEDGREARLGFKFQFTSREMDDKQLRWPIGIGSGKD